MPRLAVLAVSLSSLSWTGEAFLASAGTAKNTHVNPSHCLFQRRRRRHVTERLTQEGPVDERDPYQTIQSLTSYRRPSRILMAAMLDDSSPPGNRNSNTGRQGQGKKSPGWHRKILGKMAWRRESTGQRRGSKSSSSLTSSTVEHGETDILIDSFTLCHNTHLDNEHDFLVHNFEVFDPDEVLPVIQVEPKILSKSSHDPSHVHSSYAKKLPESPESLSLDSEYFDIAILKPKQNLEKVNEELNLQTSKKGVVCRILQNVLTERINERWTKEVPEGLKVDIRSSSDKYNNIGRLLFKGRYRADATLSSERIVFENIRISSIRAEIEQVTLNLLGFFASDENGIDESRTKCVNEKDERGRKILGGSPSNTYSSSMVQKSAGIVRYPKQFDIHIQELTMTRHDLLFSSCVRNGLRRLLIRLLNDRGLRSDSICITSIDILPDGKISCVGEGKTHFVPAPPVRFEVRSGIGFSNQGHVLTFPGLEVSLNRDIGLFVPVHPTLDLDVGHNTKFHNIVIDGRKKRLKIAASVTITPDRTRIMQNHVQNSDAFAAIFSFDIGQWLTRLLRFSK